MKRILVFFLFILVAFTTSSAWAGKLDEYANPRVFISVADLKAKRDAGEKLLIVDIQGKKFIPGSVSIRRNELLNVTPAEGEYYGTVKSNADVASVLGHVGITRDTFLVLTSSEFMMDVGRLFWVLEGLGHSRMVFLDGGTTAWEAAGNPVVDDPAVLSPVEYGSFAKDTGTVMAMTDEIIKAQKNSKALILDVRTQKEHSGQATLRRAAGPGAVGNAVWIEFSKAFNKDKTLKPLAELKTIYTSGYDSYYAYCHNSTRGAMTWFVLKYALGFKNVKTYDGAWIEWSDRLYNKGEDLFTINTKQ